MHNMLSTERRVQLPVRTSSQLRMYLQSPSRNSWNALC